MIEARIRFDEDGTDVADGVCQIAAIPPIGGHISLIDRNSNRCILHVTDVVIGAVSARVLEELPSVMSREIHVTIFGTEAFGHHFSDRSGH